MNVKRNDGKTKPNRRLNGWQCVAMRTGQHVNRLTHTKRRHSQRPNEIRCSSVQANSIRNHRYLYHFSVLTRNCDAVGEMVFYSLHLYIGCSWLLFHFHLTQKNLIKYTALLSLSRSRFIWFRIWYSRFRTLRVCLFIFIVFLSGFIFVIHYIINAKTRWHWHDTQRIQHRMAVSFVMLDCFAIAIYLVNYLKSLDVVREEQKIERWRLNAVTLLRSPSHSVSSESKI